jgi:hypothetical protein
MSLKYVKRTLLFGFYFIVGYSLVRVSIGSGAGTGAPIPVFCSWGIPLARLLWPKIEGIVLLSLLYYFGNFVLITWVAKKEELCFKFLPFVFHAVGSVIAFFQKRGDELPLSTKVSITVVSGVIVLTYFTLDLFIARTSLKHK